MKKFLSINKKFVISCLFLLFVVGLVSCGKSNKNPKPTTPSETTPDVTTPEENGWKGAADDKLVARGEGLENAILVFHYHRNNGDYEDWGMWIWTPNADGIRKEIANDDEFGVYIKLDLGDSTQPYYQADIINYIYFLSKAGGWDEKDAFADDRSVALSAKMLNDKNEIHLYSFEGEENIYMDQNKEEVFRFIKTASLNKTADAISVTANDIPVSYSLFKDGEEIGSGVPEDKEFDSPLTEEYVVGLSYTVTLKFSDDSVITQAVNMNAYFDSADFVHNYIYDGEDLGVTFGEGTTTFKLWAPISSKVTLELFDKGHPTRLENAANPGQDEPTRKVELTKGNKGVWSVTIDEDLHGKYYTYEVVNNGKATSGIIDPYAKAAGLNGLRGYIADFEALNPEGWSYDYRRPYTSTQLVIYEMHVRDLTMDKTWTGTEANRGKYLGLAEEGTTYTQDGKTVSTGFDHIKELGVNAVQILPFFDQANDELSDKFNWGYNPQNYNVLEGQYSSNPYDAEARIREFKQVVKAYQDAGIEIIMDVVYNHMNGISGSSFDKIVPGYFFRYTSSGAPANGSGCGNETASERAMYRKYMIDSTMFLAREYNLGGFRFDLMALHDYDTMNLLAEKLHEMDPNIVVYGEPWTGGTSQLPGASQASSANIDELVNVAIFNDSIRDGIKGSVFDTATGGFIQGAAKSNTISKSLRGVFYGQPRQQINYVACHDNNTLADKLIQSGVSAEDLGKASVAANALVFFAEGITFMLNGDEFLRDKKLYDENGVWTGEYSHNSYDIPDITNSIKWNMKVENYDVFEAYKQMIAINRNQVLFQMSTQGQSYNRYKVNTSNSHAVVGTIESIPPSMEGQSEWAAVTYIVTNKKFNAETVCELTGNWVVGFAFGNTTLKVGDTVTGTISCGNYTSILLYQPIEK